MPAHQSITPTTFEQEPLILALDNLCSAFPDQILKLKMLLETEELERADKYAKALLGVLRTAQAFEEDARSNLQNGASDGAIKRYTAYEDYPPPSETELATIRKRLARRYSCIRASTAPISPDGEP